MFSETVLKVQLSQFSQDIAAGSHHSLSLSETGIWSWGKSDKLNLGKQISGICVEEPTFEKLQVDKISASSEHTFAWKQNNVYCWGSNQSYQLGLEEEKEYEIQKSEIFEEAIEAGYQLKEIACGQKHTVAVFNIQDEEDQNGNCQIFCWGQAKNYQLALDTSSIVPYPVLIDFKASVQNVYCRSDFNVILDEEGKCFAWGSNIFGRIGFPNQIKTQKIPTIIPLPVKIKSIGIGLYHVLAISQTRQCYSWGHGMHGQLGIGKIVGEIQPTKVLIEGNAKMVACGEYHSLILLQNGQLLSCGSNAQGALGHSNVDSKKRCKIPTLVENLEGNQMIKIVCGNRHNLVLCKEGNVYSWGCNKYGQLGKRNQRQRKHEFEISVPESTEKQERIECEKVPEVEGNKALIDWKMRYEKFKEEQSKMQKQFMRELEQILKFNK